MPLLAQVRDEAGGAGRVAHQQRHDRMLALDRLESERAQPVAEALRHGAQVSEQRARPPRCRRDRRQTRAASASPGVMGLE